MKLPKDSPFVILDFIPDNKPVTRITEDFIEWIVRDCAKVCQDFPTVIAPFMRDAMAKVILARYGLGEIAQGAAPLEPVAEIAYAGLGDIRRLQFVAVKETLPDKTKLYAIPEGYAVVPVEPTEANVGTYCDGWMKSFQAANLHHSDIECTEEDRVHIVAGLRAMLAAGRVK